MRDIMNKFGAAFYNIKRSSAMRTVNRVVLPVAGFLGALWLAAAGIIGMVSDKFSPEFEDGLDRALRTELNASAPLAAGKCYFKEPGREKSVTFAPSPEGGFMRGFNLVAPFVAMSNEKPVEIARIPVIRSEQCAILKEGLAIPHLQADLTAVAARHKAAQESAPFVAKFRGVEGRFKVDYVPKQQP